MSEFLSQQEIDALLRSDLNSEFEQSLTAEEMDVLGEIGNISMGAAATTLSVLLNKKVVITTPRVTVLKTEDISHECPYPSVAVEINYTEGLEGTNLLVLKRYDVNIITDLLMGGTGEVDETNEINEIQLSAIGEVMNQMMGSASTSLSSIFGHTINISPPKPMLINFSDDKPISAYADNKLIIIVAFRMEIEGLITSQIMQVMSVDFGKRMVKNIYKKTTIGSIPVDNNVDNDSNKKDAHSRPHSEYKESSHGELHSENNDKNNADGSKKHQNKVDVAPVKFQSFDDAEPNRNTTGDNLDLILDIPLQVSVVLGRAKKEVREILSLSTGSIIELDKLAGEPVEILVNGKQIALGEVVVIDENFGVRINDIISPAKRIQKLGQ